MSGLRLTIKDDHPGFDSRELFLPGWELLDGGALLRREVVMDNRRVPLGDLATASGSPGGEAILEGNWSRAEWLGAGLAAGTVEVRGNVGGQAGAGMAGGRLVVHGDAEYGIAGAFPGQKRGMTGGEVIVHGNVGDGAGRAMRRGLLAVGGNVGRAAGYSMLAGTIVCFGAVGADAGLLNKRGSIVAAGSIAIPPVYRYACSFRPAFVSVVLRRLRDLHGFRVTASQLDGAWRRWSGDFAELGKGEILAWEQPT